MIYVDVTGACLLPLQSGIPRTTRGVYRLLEKDFPEITPIFWQPFRGSYTKLSPRARALLDDPFANRQRLRCAPRDSTIPLLWASFCDLIFSRPQIVPLPKLMRTEDTLLLTSIFPDNRLKYLERLVTGPGFKIAIFHDAIPLRDPNVAQWEKARHIQTLRLFAQMDRVVAVSQAASKELQALWVEHGISPRASVGVIPWPVPFTTSRPSFSQPPWDKKTVLYVSRLKQIKNHAILFEVCETFWRDGIDFTLELIGCEDEAKESRQLVREIKRLQKMGRPISWRAQVTEEKLHAAYQHATFTVFPSLMEGFGLPIIESFWHGRAVICSDRDAMGEVSSGSGCLQVNVRDAHALAAVMSSLLQDQARCEALSKEAYERPLRSWDDYGRELKTILENR